MELSTIRAFQGVCRTFTFRDKPTSFSEDFAMKRYLKKMQEPDDSHLQLLKDQCWSNWIEFDEQLPNQIVLPSSAWYRCRARLHRLLGNGKHFFQQQRIRLPKGSEFTPTRGRNSLESRLCRSEWTCTYTNFELFAKVCYSVYGLRKSAKIRYDRWFRRQDFDMSRNESDSFLYRKFSGARDPGFEIFKFKLSLITKFENGSRFSTVPKDNSKRRPINVECFGNTLTQSVIGEGIRSLLKERLDIDLDTLAVLHRRKVSEPDRWATIDLSNASDSVSIALCEFLFPEWFMKLLMESRSDFVLGPDKIYYPTRKISSMGNGFTFELMTLILTCLCKEYDQDATVFGDDITISPIFAESLINDLTEVGFAVNSEKSFWTGPFRESCGANYHSEEGYVKSYDFKWPSTIGDCVNLMNKAFMLSKYNSFRALYSAFLRVLPKALHGGPCSDFFDEDSDNRSRHWLPINHDLPLYFITPKFERHGLSDTKIVSKLIELQYDPSEFSLVRGYEFKSKLLSDTLSDLNGRRHWAKYLMYLDAGRRSKDVISGDGEYVKVYFVTNGSRIFRASTLKP